MNSIQEQLNSILAQTKALSIAVGKIFQKVFIVELFLSFLKNLENFEISDDFEISNN